MAGCGCGLCAVTLASNQLGGGAARSLAPPGACAGLALPPSPRGRLTRHLGGGVTRVTQSRPKGAECRPGRQIPSSSSSIEDAFTGTPSPCLRWEPEHVGLLGVSAYTPYLFGSIIRGPGTVVFGGN